MNDDVTSYLASAIATAHAMRRIVAVGMIDKGPDAGQPIMATATRTQMLQYVEWMREPAQMASFMDSVCRDIRGLLAKGVDRLSKEERTDLIGNTILLMAAKLATDGDDHVLSGSGLKSLTLAVDYTGEASWDHRGFLRPEDATAVAHG